MAKNFQPYGLSLYNDNGSNYSGTLQNFPLLSESANSLYCGDPVCLTLDGSVFINSSATTTSSDDYSPIVGVFQGCTYTNLQGQKIRQAYWEANTEIFVATINGTSTNLYGDAILQPVSSRIIYKVASNNSETVASTPATYATPTDAINDLLGYKFDMVYLGTNVGGQSMGALNIASDGTSGAFTVIGVATTPQSNAGQQWCDPYPDLLVICNSTNTMFS